MIKNLLLMLLLSVNFNVCMGAEETPLHFALITPRESNDAFWSLNEDFALAVAKDLGFKMSIFYGKNSKKHMLNSLHKAKKLGVDAVIFANVAHIGVQLINTAETLQLPILIYNTDIASEHSKKIGHPQQYLKYWLARLMPNDYQAGYILAKSLIKQARQQKLTNDKGEIEIIAISGVIGDSPSIQRLAGLKVAIKEEKNTKLLQIVYANWKQEKSLYKTHKLHQRYPQAKVYWAASDLIAIGVYQALSKRGLQQGKHYITGGIDWTTQGLIALRKGDISISVGGHFMDAGWATIMLYDHFKGFTFTDSHLNNYQSQFLAITQADVQYLFEQINDKNWSTINFHQFSKFHNKQLNSYPLNPALILKINHTGDQ